jgi:hypothetical protein
MGRPHIEFVNVQELPAREVCEGVFAGARWRLLSEDDQTGALTALAHLPEGFAGQLGGFDRPVELFGLGGELLVDRQRLGAGCYAYLAPSHAQRPLQAPTGADVLIMIEGQTDAFSPAPVHVIDTARMRWQASSAPGLSVKWLRIDGQTGDRSWVAASCPRKQENRAEIHPTVEECLMLRGDCLLGTRGEMGPGGYFWRPPYVQHGPLCTRNGAMYFFRSKGGDFETTYAEVAGWEEMVREYFAREPYIAIDLQDETVPT